MQRHYIIHGRVQGVFFRDSTRHKARELGVGGWVRNRPEGTVEAVAQGDPEAVSALEQWFRDGGPRHARVDELEVSEQEEGVHPSFEVR
jgi:acylphosphatase